MPEPLVSILIAVYNAGEYLRPSLQSILSQTYPNLEILLIDDGSTDGCMDSIADIEDSRIRIIAQQNSGKAAAINRALDELSGEFYAIQDADDISYPQRIELQVRCMLENPDIAVVFSGNDIIVDGRRIAPEFTGKTIEQCRRDIKLLRMPAHDPTAMYRISMVGDMRYDPALKVAEGLDYILRVGERYPMMVLGQCLYSYRFKIGSLSRQDTAVRNELVRKVIIRACQRRGCDVSEQFFYEPSSTGSFGHRGKENNIVAHFMQSVIDLRGVGRSGEALQTALSCVKLHSFDPHYYKPLLYTITPLSVIDLYRSAKDKFSAVLKIGPAA
jgi:glycosyltransferase involved in cell wall biosynthesis